MHTHVAGNKEPSRVWVVMVVGGDGRLNEPLLCRKPDERTTSAYLEFFGVVCWISSACVPRASSPGALAKSKGVVDGLFYVCSKCHVFVVEMWKAPKSLQTCVQEKFLGEDSFQWCNKLQFAPNVKYYKCG